MGEWQDDLKPQTFSKRISRMGLATSVMEVGEWTAFSPSCILTF